LYLKKITTGILRCNCSLDEMEI